MIDRRSLIVGTLFASIGGPSFGQSKFPARTVTVVNPFAAGGQLDPLGRLLCNRFQTVFGQAFIMESKPGAGGTIGGQFVARAAPDGHVLLLGTTSTFVIAPYMFKPQPYDPLTQLAPIVNLTQTGSVLVASEKSGFKNLKELLDAARQKPGGVTVASAGIGSFPHIFAELFSSLADVKFTHVPYRGGGPAMNDIIGGQVDIFFEVVSSAAPQVQSKRVVPLFVSGDSRSALLPDVPTAAELGYPKANLTSWTGLATPAGTPASVIEMLNKEANEVLNSSEMKRYLEQFGFSAVGGSAAEMAARIARESAIYKELVRSRGIGVQ